MKSRTAPTRHKPRLQRRFARPACATSHKREVRIIPAHCERADRVLGRVVVDRHCPIAQELRQCRPIAQRVVNRLGRGIGLDQQLALRLQPGLQCIGHRLGLQLPHQQPVPGFELLGLALDLVELGDQRYGLAGNLAAIELMRISANVTGDFGNVTGLRSGAGLRGEDCRKGLVLTGLATS